MSDRVLFDFAPYTASSTTNVDLPLSGYRKPSDSFNVPPVVPGTIWYLCTIKPHTDSHTISGPVKTFLHLVPEIEAVISNSPRAIDKLEALREIENVWGEREKNLDFDVSGFERFVVEGQRGVYTVLQVVREVDKEVRDVLPSPVYTVVSVGPLVHGVVLKARKMKKTMVVVGEKKSNSLVDAGDEEINMPKGYAATTRLHGSWVERNKAMQVAKEVMGELLRDEENVKGSERWETGGKGGGVIMAMSPTKMWKVRVLYEDLAVVRAGVEAGMEGEGVGWR
ncbi:hypothetical protein DDE83_003380 [Stemphylium lycopersici]|uniref:Uncharacterized protein n=1 Tax=Stemphylium lycopersici TaxID=183478 RepID=A0A364N7K5_STELY|nr:hypothetical protein DDE83_003380 [Stemphylium lycopersici]